MRSALFALAGCFAAACATAPERRHWSVTSPDGAVTLELTTMEGALRYRVSHAQAGAPVVEWSALGLIGTSTGDEASAIDFSRTATVVGVERRAIRETYEMVSGKRRHNAAMANELLVTIRDDETGRRLDVLARAYPEGAALRYASPPGAAPMRVQRDATTFKMPLGGLHFSHPYDHATQWTPANESPHTFGVPIGAAVAPGEGAGWSFPSLFDLGRAFVLLSEAGMTPGAHASHLAPDPVGGVYRVQGPLAGDGEGFGDPTPVLQSGWRSPWRVIAVGVGLSGIVENNLVHHLAEPSRLGDVGWIRPGLASWSWLTDHDSSRDLRSLERFIDFAAEWGLPYSLVDANWTLIPGDPLAELSRYAAARDVRLLFWYNSGGPNNSVTEQPRDRVFDPATRRREFAALRAAGVAGVKIDFFQSDKREIMQLYEDILADAAAEKLLVVFHGSTIPRGLARTWPNLMSMEGVRGAEFYTFPSQPPYGAYAARANTVLPFTRNVIGSMDYTPILFSRQLVERVTTDAHEAALGIIFESAIQHLADEPASYQAQPASVQTYLRHLETAWDDTKLLAGYPGRDVILARRKGDRWFVAGLNGEGARKTIKLPLDRIAATGPALLLGDGPSGIVSQDLQLTASGLEITMEAYGGFVLVTGLSR